MISLLLSRVEAGGLERVQFTLAHALRERGECIEIVAGRVVTSSGAVSEVHCIAPRGAWQFLLRLPFWMRKRRPALVVTTSNDVAVWVLLCRRLLAPDVPVVVTQHLAVSGPRRTARGMRRLKLDAMRWLMCVVYPAADVIIAVSEAVALDMRAELGLPDGRVRVIHNPIVGPLHDAGELRVLPRPAKWPFPLDGTPVVIFVGRLSAEKRIDLLLSAFLQVKATRPVRLLIVGEGGLADFAGEWAQEHALAQDFQMVGRVDDALPWIQHSDVLALPSDYEGFGNVLVEAMQCGTQIVATDCPSGPAEILCQGKYGQLVPVGNSNALAAALTASLDGSFHVETEELLRRAADFSVDRAVDAYAQVFNRLRGSRGRASRC